MTDRKLTDEEVVKALECCKDCSINLNFEIVQKIEDKNKEILELIDIINRQKAEIEKLKECPKCVYEYDDEVIEYCIQGPCPNFKPVHVGIDLSIKQIKAEAYKEFAKRLENKIKTECNPYGKPTYDYDTSISIMNYMDNLLKEMVGEEE